MADYGNVIEKSPIVHPEIAGRGVEYSHGRAAFYYSSRCNGVLGDMEDLVCRAYDKHNIPQELAAKFERRTNDYQRCYRMGVLSKDLEKMRAEIKTHRNMMDYHQRFIQSPSADDATDSHVFHRQALAKILPQKMIPLFGAPASVFSLANCHSRTALSGRPAPNSRRRIAAREARIRRFESPAGPAPLLLLAA